MENEIKKYDFKENFKDRGKVVVAVLLVVLALFSFFIVADYMTDAKNFTGTLKKMDEKSEQVIALTGGASAASAAISLLPGDAGTPIAENLADLSGYFLIILAAIYLEKWLVTVSGLVAFKFLIPICLLIFAVMQFWPRESIKKLAWKVILLSVLIVVAVPTSVVLSDLIDKSYQATMEQTLEEAEDSSNEIQEKVKGEEDENVITQIFESIKGGVTGQIDKFKNILSKFIQAIAVLLVTSCAIPIAVIAFFLWLIKNIAGIDVKVPNFRLSEKINSLRAS